MISLENKVGALAKIIEPSKNKISMSKIESIPTKKNNWEYMFLIDIDGHMSDNKIYKTLLEIERKSQFLETLALIQRVFRCLIKINNTYQPGLSAEIVKKKYAVSKVIN